MARVGACESGGRLVNLRGSRDLYGASCKQRIVGSLATTDRAIPWLDTRCSNVIGPEIAPSPSLALGAGESPKTTENFVVYIFVVRESRNTLDCTTCGNVTTVVFHTNLNQKFKCTSTNFDTHLTIMQQRLTCAQECQFAA